MIFKTYRTWIDIETGEIIGPIIAEKLYYVVDKETKHFQPNRTKALLIKKILYKCRRKPQQTKLFSV